MRREFMFMGIAIQQNHDFLKTLSATAFKIKILGALSVGDGREKYDPLPDALPKPLS
jgi:hypothetical protein